MEYVKTIPRIIIETLATLNLCPSLLSKIMVDEITKDVSIVIVDFADADEVDESKLLWENQINSLKHVIGSV